MNRETVRHVALSLALFCLWGFTNDTVAEDFSGDWSVWFCPPGVKPDPEKCSNFALVLYVQSHRLCGSHSFGTPRGGRMDEGAAPSIIGAISKNTAAATIESGRSGQKMRIHLNVSGNRLRWHRLDQPEGDYLLPVSAQLRRAVRGTVLDSRLVAELEAACTVQLNRTPHSDAREALRLASDIRARAGGRER